MSPLPYTRGKPKIHPHPLEPYFPGYHQGVLSSWLAEQPVGEDLVLDPFGSSPRMILEGARSGYRILAAVNNPITRLVIRRLARPLTREQLNTAAASMGGMYKGEDRLEPHLLSLYETDCPHCGARISARAFLWNQKQNQPVRKVCQCSRCGDQGEYPTSQEDIDQAHRFQDQSLYRARALTRVAPPGDPVHIRAEKALQIYPPRAVYALFNLINKFTGLPAQAEHREALTVLLLTAFARGHGLQPRSPEQPLPQELKIPGRFQENNIWYAFQSGISLWTAEDSPVPVLDWPELPPPSGGISLYPGRFQSLAPDLNSLPIGSTAAVPPSLDPVMWTLSALWSGWLWGQEASASLRGVLSLNKLNWGWFTRALEHNLAILRDQGPEELPLLEALGGLSSEFLISTYTATRSAGFRPRGAALDPDSSGGQLVWTAESGSIPAEPEDSLKAVLRDGGYHHLRESGQPRHTYNLQAAGLHALADAGLIPHRELQSGEESMQAIQDAIAETYAYRQGFLHYPETETWWHQELPLDPLPLADRVEMELVNLLVADHNVTRDILEETLYRTFPGEMTPPGKLIDVCLDSYGQVGTGAEPTWTLNPGDLPDKRVRDLEEMGDLLRQIGERLEFETHKLPPIGQVQVYRWAEGEENQATFFLSASGLLNKILLKYTRTPPRPWIIIPGSRARLVTYKLQHNPPLADTISEEWGFIKFRHLRRLGEEISLTRDTYLERFKLDPLTYDAPQLPLI